MLSQGNKQVFFLGPQKGSISTTKKGEGSRGMRKKRGMEEG